MGFDDVIVKRGEPVSEGEVHGCILIVVGVVVVIIMAIVIGLTTPDSQNVSFEGRSAVIHDGGELVLTQQVGKVHYVWIISKDGDEVFMECSGCPDNHPQLCGIHCTIRAGLVWPTKVSITQLNDTELLVEWPWGVFKN